MGAEDKHDGGEEEVEERGDDEEREARLDGRQERWEKG